MHSFLFQSMDIRESFARRQTSHDKTLQFTPIQSRLINSSTGKNKKNVFIILVGTVTLYTLKYKMFPNTDAVLSL